MAEDEDRKLMTNVNKCRALKHEVFSVAHSVGRAMTAKALAARHLARLAAHNRQQILAAKPKP